MSFGSIDRRDDTDTDEFEKLEFLPEQSPTPDPEADDTSEIVFTPETEAAPEPPVAFNPAEETDPESAGGVDDPAAPPELDFGGSTPFELFGTSLFDESDIDDLGALDSDSIDDDLEF